MAEQDLLRLNRDIPQVCHVRGLLVQPAATVHTAAADKKDEEKNIPFQFRPPDHCNSIVAGFRWQRDEGHRLDVTLKVGPIAIRAHRIFLSAFSLYFDKLFNIQMIESTQDEFELRDVNGPALAALIDYAYEGELTISPDNVQYLLQTADFLNLEVVCDACCSYLKRNLELDNCFAILQLAKSLDKKELVGWARRFALEHFEDITSSEEFLSLPLEILSDYLADNELIITENGYVTAPGRQEELVLEAILRYVDSDVKIRSGLLVELISRRTSRLSLIEKSRLFTYKSRPLLADSDRALAAIDDVLQSSTLVLPRSLPGLCHELSKPLPTKMMIDVDGPVDKFNDLESTLRSNVVYVRGMKVLVCQWDGRPVIGGLEVLYSNGVTVTHGGRDYGGDEEIAEFRFQNDSERIVAATIKTGLMIDSVSFTTSRGNMIGPYGGSGGGKQHLKAPTDGGYLAGLAGDVGITQNSAAIRRLQLIWGYYKYES